MICRKCKVANCTSCPVKAKASSSKPGVPLVQRRKQPPKRKTRSLYHDASGKVRTGQGLARVRSLDKYRWERRMVGFWTDFGTFCQRLSVPEDEVA